MALLYKIPFSMIMENGFYELKIKMLVTELYKMECNYLYKYFNALFIVQETCRDKYAMPGLNFFFYAVHTTSFVITGIHLDFLFNAKFNNCGKK